MAAESLTEPIEKRIEVIVVDDEYATVWMVAVEEFQVSGDLQPHRRLARPFLTEDDRSRRLGWIAEHLVPRRVEGAADAVILEDLIGLRVFLRERIVGDAVVLEKLRCFHDASVKSVSEEVLDVSFHS